MTETIKQPARTIFHIDLDAFFVTVEQVLNPSLQNKCVIVGGRPEGRGVVASASYECRKFGVHAAMPLARAKQLCPQAIFLTGNYRKYTEFSHKFMDILADYTPCIETGGLDEAYLDVTGCENFGSWRNLALRIKERVKNQTGLIASVGIAANKVVAKIASDLSKPDGLIEVLPGREKNFLAPLAVRKLPGVGEKTAVLMKSAGIETIGQLADMHPELLKSRFGEGMMWLREHARGIDHSLVEERGEAKSISRETTFEKDTMDTELLRAKLRYFSEKLGADLRGSGKKARTVTLKLRYSDFSTVNRSQTSREAVNLDDIIFQSAVSLLDRTLGNKYKPVRLIGLEVSNLVAGETQLGLFDADSKRLEKVDHAIDYIRDKYGFDAIQTGYTLELKQKYEGRTVEE